MIQNDAQLKQTAEQLQLMYEVLAELRRRDLPVSKTKYQLFAEGPIEEIRRLRAEIDEYLGLSEPAAVAEPAERASA